MSCKTNEYIPINNKDGYKDCMKCIAINGKIIALNENNWSLLDTGIEKSINDNLRIIEIEPIAIRHKIIFCFEKSIKSPKNKFFN